MDLEFVKSSIRKSRYENEASQIKGMKIGVTVNLELLYPNSVKEGSPFLLVGRVAVGNPVQKFSIFIEQVCTFKIVNLEEGFDTSRENMQKFISVICHPIALKELQRAMDGLTTLYELTPIKIPTTMAKPQGDAVDMTGNGLPN
ncbi:MAG: hypothetical protein PUB22_05220 [Clostridiales bacterium]|nr:hypothetical protein [Clostridiales bacterium]